MIMPAMTWELPLQEPPTIINLCDRSRHPVHQDGVDRYRLNRIWCLNLYEGNGLLRINGGVFPIRHGHASITVPGFDMEYDYAGRAYLTFAHFIPQGGGTVPIPVMQDLGSRFGRMRQELAAVMGTGQIPPARAAARLWELLWELATSAAVPPLAEPPVLTDVRRRIAGQLSEPLYVPVLAREAGIPHLQLLRLFKRHLGCSIARYIRDQRLERARFLLKFYDYPVKEIAAQTGFAGDQHQFNKVFRRVVGCSPTRYRQTSGRGKPQPEGGAGPRSEPVEAG
ncbi:MAG: AraC family transcriptional regulator [Lentisphaeria bacterium]